MVEQVNQVAGKRLATATFRYQEHRKRERDHGRQG